MTPRPRPARPARATVRRITIRTAWSLAALGFLELALHLAVLALVLVAGCAGPTAPRNRAGVFGAPSAIGAEYERFVDGDADHGSWSIGLTVGHIWDGVDRFLSPPRKKSASLLAINPFVRWHAYRPTEWLTLGVDAKLSFVWFFPDREAGRARFAMAVESHGTVAVDHSWAYALVGVGVKQFLFRRDVDGSRFPGSLTNPAGEVSLGLRF